LHKGAQELAVQALTFATAVVFWQVVTHPVRINEAASSLPHLPSLVDAVFMLILGQHPHAVMLLHKVSI
jgi:hypothetical protein